MLGRSKLDDEHARVVELQPLDDLGARRRVGGGGERHARHAGKRSCSTDSPRYSGRKSWPHCDTQCASSIANSATVRAIEQLEAARRQQPLGRDVQQIELARREGALDRARSARRSVELSAAARTPASRQRRHLVLHQRDQRRDDDAVAVAQQRRNLVAQGLAAAGRHQHQRVAARATWPTISSCAPRNAA